MDGWMERQRGDRYQETGGEKVFTKTTERGRLGEDEGDEGEEDNGLKDGGEDAEGWDVGKKQGLTEIGR